jgi:predicted lipid-binding transport protein (Tim44 family)
MDIIILAALAIFIFFKLRGELGKVDDEQKRDGIKNFIKEQTKTSAGDENPNVITINHIDEKSQKILNKLDSEIKKDLEPVLEKSKISAANFMKGAEMAFESIIESFAEGKVETLKPLLSDKIFQQFESVIKQRQAQNQSLNTKILAIKESKIIAAKMLQNFAHITVRFTTEQINYLTNNQGEVIDGSKEDVNDVTDIWTFKKDCTSANPNWFVASTDTNNN